MAKAREGYCVSCGKLRPLPRGGMCRTCLEDCRTSGAPVRKTFKGGRRSSSNPRYANSAKRTRIRKWLLATQDVCALCGKPIDKSLKTPHPMSAEVDEIIPISLGGSPISRDNVQLTHRICNQRKSNRIATAAPKVIEQPLPTSRDWGI